MHRIGRTGRSGKTGIATTFINKNQSESILLDLKHLLKEAKQRIPPVLLALHDPMDALEALEAASGKRVRNCIHHCALYWWRSCPVTGNFKSLHMGGATGSAVISMSGSCTPPHVCFLLPFAAAYIPPTFSWWSDPRCQFRHL